MIYFFHAPVETDMNSRGWLVPPPTGADVSDYPSRMCPHPLLKRTLISASPGVFLIIGVLCSSMLHCTQCGKVRSDCVRSRSKKRILHDTKTDKDSVTCWKRWSSQWQALTDFDVFGVSWNQIQWFSSPQGNKSFLKSTHPSKTRLCCRLLRQSCSNTFITSKELHVGPVELNPRQFDACSSQENSSQTQGADWLETESAPWQLPRQRLRFFCCQTPLQTFSVTKPFFLRRPFCWNSAELWCKHCSVCCDLSKRFFIAKQI